MTKSLTEEQEKEKKKAAGFQHCSECSSPFPATDKHHCCLRCLGPDHRPRECDLCRAMGSRALKNREQRLQDLFGGPSASLSLSGSAGHRGGAESDRSDLKQGESQSSQGHDSSHRSPMASKASRKAFPKHKAPTSTAPMQMPRVASEPRLSSTPLLPASAEAGDAPVLLRSNWDTEREVCVEVEPPKTLDLSPRSTTLEARVVSGPMQGSSKRNRDSSPGSYLSSQGPVLALRPLIRELLSCLHSLDPGPPIPEAPLDSSFSSVLAIHSQDPVPEPHSPTQSPALVLASASGPSIWASGFSTSRNTAESSEAVQAGPSGMVPKRVFRTVLSSDEEDGGEGRCEIEGFPGEVPDALYTSASTNSELGAKFFGPAQDAYLSCWRR
nr:PREDICTED: lactosylceramide alpha-2,3-sialyltransferase isoform X1 [Latimeria chalumnae]|eukprot:XP_006003187.1 PREDICTED: lactosylceramide alpha-2,3-sialyltransferase isoform X1 [Latimeria chalumnae]